MSAGGGEVPPPFFQNELFGQDAQFFGSAVEHFILLPEFGHRFLGSHEIRPNLTFSIPSLICLPYFSKASFWARDNSATTS